MQRPKPHRRKFKLYWFCRAFAVTALLLSCVLLLIFGLGYCENKMAQNSGFPAKSPLSRNQNGIYFYGHRIF